METQTNPCDVIDTIKQAVDKHDLDALAECFHPNYVSEQPFHPDLNFRGREQMRRNWSQIFHGVPDIQANVLRNAVDGITVWTEWELRGTRSDGVAALVAMVTIAGIEHGQVAWMRLYLEPVVRGGGIDASVSEQITAKRRRQDSSRAPESSGGDE